MTAIELTPPAPAHLARPQAQLAPSQPMSLTPPVDSKEDGDVARLRGGCSCLFGHVSCTTGPCVCSTNGQGCLGTLACCVAWPINALVGATCGILNCLTCGCCSCQPSTCVI